MEPGESTDPPGTYMTTTPGPWNCTQTPPFRKMKTIFQNLSCRAPFIICVLGFYLLCGIISCADNLQDVRFAGNVLSATKMFSNVLCLCCQSQYYSITMPNQSKSWPLPCFAVVVRYNELKEEITEFGALDSIS